ncbi:cache domain-containing protein [bacterium]|nr:cache domain-containing protein [bacterium]
MFKKLIPATAFILAGTLFLHFLVQRAMDAEKGFFQDLFLKNNKEISFLVARSLFDQLRQMKRRTEGFAHLLSKEEFNPGKLRDYFRYNFESDPFISGIRIHQIEAQKWTELYNITAQVRPNSFYLGVVEKNLTRVYDRNRDWFSPPFQIPGSKGGRPSFSWIQMVRASRKNSIPGVMESRIDIGALFESSSRLGRSGRGGVLLVQRGLGILSPEKGGWQLSEADMDQIFQQPMGGFLRVTENSTNLLSFCSLRVLDRLNMPDWSVVVIEDQREMKKVTQRLEWNLFVLLGVGVLCLLLLAKLFFFR